MIRALILSLMIFSLFAVKQNNGDQCVALNCSDFFSTCNSEDLCIRHMKGCLVSLKQDLLTLDDGDVANNNFQSCMNQNEMTHRLLQCAEARCASRQFFQIFTQITQGYNQMFNIIETIELPRM